MTPLRKTLLVLLAALVAAPGCKDDDPKTTADATEDATTEDGTTAEDGTAEDSEADTVEPPTSVPLAEGSPWPKFRRDAAQTAMRPTPMTDDGRDFWVFQTDKGIFSSPVIGADGTVFIGSADRNFYAINPDGTEKWSFLTGEIIDSSALLDDKGRVYFGSGDGFLYALDAATGSEVWSFQADDPSNQGAFIRWFEGNVAIGPDGTLYAGNDNFLVYAIDRDTGEPRWTFRMQDQTWSLPAIDLPRGQLVTGNNNVVELLGDNVFAIDLASGKKNWSTRTLGTIAASPIIAGDTVMLGSFDGIERAYDAATGDALWTFDTRDHIYASTSMGADGSAIVASTDGSVYAIDPATGAQRWAFDWGAPMRSSPAVDGEGHIYLGTGDGHLLVLNGDGTLRWALRLIKQDRDDLNGSPALGDHAVYLAGESGEIFGVPYDFCLRAAEAANPDCVAGPDELLPAEGDFLFFTTDFGSLLTTPPTTVEANQPLAFTLQIREGGDTRLALINDSSVEVSITPDVDIDVEIAANRQFLMVVPPETGFTPDGDGNITLTLSGDYLVDPDREGLRFSGGVAGGSFSETFTFALGADAVHSFPLPVPSAPGEASGVFEMRRLAAPLPTLLPSYNQIGFDALHYLIGMVEGDGQRMVGWLVEATPGSDGEVKAIPGTRGMFPFEITYDGGRVTLVNQQGLSLEVLSATIAFNSFRVSARIDDGGDAIDAAEVYATTVCEDIPFYGSFLRGLGLCNPNTDLLNAFGATLLERRPDQSAPAGLGTVAFDVTATGATATLTGSTLQADAHSFALLLVDAATGSPVSLDYGPTLETTADGSGNIATVTLPYDTADVPDSVRLYLMVDTYPAYVETATVP